MTETIDVIDDYVAAWNQTDRAVRHRAVHELYTADSRVVTASVDARGIEEVLGHIDQVVTGYIGPDKHRFRQAGVAAHHDCLLVRWEMIIAHSGEPADWGINSLVLDSGGRIRADYQFVAPSWLS